MLKEAFEVFVNKDIGNTTTAELLSTFCDNIMKTGGDKLEGEIDQNLDKIVMLFSYLSDKDMFAEFYRYARTHSFHSFTLKFFTVTVALASPSSAGVG